jgi:hypothetical protein
MNQNKSDKCEICGKPLKYAISLEEYKELHCEFCNKLFNTNTFCEDEHYICDSCHSKGPIEVIEEFCENTSIKDPFEIADLIMKHPKFKMYGPEHHILTPVVILTSLRNNNIRKQNGELINLFDIKEAIRRASKIPGGWCGFYGSCGAGMGSGIAVSIFTGATPSTAKQRSLANEMTSKSLAKIADNLEHCCKRSVKLSICASIDFFKSHFDIDLNYNHNACEFSKVNDRCEGTNCLFF